jgi:hypothetical protein
MLSIPQEKICCQEIKYMAIVLPFKAVRPDKKFVAQVAALPYDVMTRKKGKKRFPATR